jgi:hypothetical protein
MKIYIHEESPYDEVFRGARSYEEVQNRFQTLPPAKYMQELEC